MPVTIESFPHGGEHLANDLSQSHMVLWMIGVFALLASLAIALGIGAL